MTEPRNLTEDVLVSGQIDMEDIRRAPELGVRRIVNNRPDGEDVGQPTSNDIRAAAALAGIDYVHAPATGLPGPEVVSMVAQALADGGRTWMYCRSGMRSTAAWAMATAGAGDLDTQQIREIAARAGYDISRLPL